MQNNKAMECGRDIEKGETAYESVPVGHEEWESDFSPEILKAKSPLPSSCCIFRVPEVLRRQKKEAYEPDVVSIGPFHRGRHEKFQLVEDVKKWYLKCLVARQLPSRPEGWTVAQLIESMRETELTDWLKVMTESIKKDGQDQRARTCYSDPCDDLLSQDEFIKMLILDGCFLIELFRKANAPPQLVSLRQDANDPIFNLPCMLEYLFHDLLLLENQLPWFVLEFFYDKIESVPNRDPLSKVVLTFFKDSVADPKIFHSHDETITSSGREVLHILDLIRTALVDIGSEDDNKTTNRNHTLPQRIPSAATLKDDGVHFKKGQQGCILNITFDRGVFTIPPLAIDERTGPLFRNLIAFEQCYHSRAHKITSYAVLMDNLIDTNKDVDLLCDKKILANWLSAEDALKFFNDLYTDTTVIDFVHRELSDRVLAYHNYRWNWFMAILKRDYFGTPWKTIAFVAAFVALVLTFLQTLFTIHKP